MSSFWPCCWGGANGDLGWSGEKPRNKKVLTKLARSGRSLRMHKTTPSQSNFSSANSRRDRNDCLLASWVRVLGRATYNMLFSWSKTWKSWNLAMEKMRKTWKIYRIPFGKDFVSDIQLDCDARWWFLRNNLRDEIIFIVAFAFSVAVLGPSFLLHDFIFDLLVDERKLLFRVVNGWRVLRSGVEGRLAWVINYKWRLIVISSLFCNYIRSTTAALNKSKTSFC